jgi:hypothetical protein
MFGWSKDFRCFEARPTFDVKHDRKLLLDTAMVCAKHENNIDKFRFLYIDALKPKHRPTVQANFNFNCQSGRKLFYTHALQ